MSAVSRDSSLSPNSVQLIHSPLILILEFSLFLISHFSFLISCFLVLISFCFVISISGVSGKDPLTTFDENTTLADAVFYFTLDVHRSPVCDAGE